MLKATDYAKYKTGLVFFSNKFLNGILDFSSLCIHKIRAKKEDTSSCSLMEWMHFLVRVLFTTVNRRCPMEYMYAQGKLIS